jgi:hypothetical protein
MPIHLTNGPLAEPSFDEVNLIDRRRVYWGEMVRSLERGSTVSTLKEEE